MSREVELLSCYDVVNYLQMNYNITYCSIAWKVDDNWYCPLMLINGKKIFNFTCEQESSDDLIFIVQPEIDYEMYLICKMHLYKFMKEYIIEKQNKISIHSIKWMSSRLKQIDFTNLNLAVNKLTHIILDNIDYNKLFSNTMKAEKGIISFNSLLNEIKDIVNHYQNIKLEYIMDSLEDIEGYHTILKQIIINIITYIKKDIITVFITKNNNVYSLIIEGEIHNENEFILVQDSNEDMELNFIYMLCKFFSCSLFKTQYNCFCINFTNSLVL